MNAQLGLGALLTDTFVRLAASIRFKKDENVLKENSVFVVHVMQAYIDRNLFIYPVDTVEHLVMEPFNI